MADSLGRKHILDTAAAAVLSDRNKAYGSPEDNFQNIADVWNWWLKSRLPAEHSHIFTPADVAYMMILMKMARLKTNPTHADSVVDVAGYAATAGDFLSAPAPYQDPPATWPYEKLRPATEPLPTHTGEFR